MGFDINLIKTLTKTVNECKAVSRKGYGEVFQLSKESPLRKMGFNEIEEYHGSPGIWSLKGENSHLEFCEGKTSYFVNIFNPRTKILVAEDSKTVWYNSGTVVKLTEDGKNVLYGSGNNVTRDSLLRGFTRTKDKITFHHIEGQQEDITVPLTTPKRKIQEILFKLLRKRLPVQKWSVQEFDQRIAEDFSEELVKPVHDYLEGNLNKDELIKLIRKYKKCTPSDVIPSKNEMIIGNLHVTVPTHEKLYPDISRTCPQSNSLNELYRDASKDEDSKKILDEFFTAMGMKHHQGSPLYRFIGKSEYDKLVAGEVVKSQAEYNHGVRFDVTPIPDGFWGEYRVKLNVEASPKTMYEDCSKRPLISCQKSEKNYYHWHVPQYDINDVRAIVDWCNKKVIYESDEEILSNFIDGYISKLG